MKHTFEHGQVPVICDLEKAKQTKTEIDALIENEINEEREKWIKAGNTKIVSFLLATLFSILSYNATVKWLTFVLMCITAIFLLVCGCTLYGTRKPDKSREFLSYIEKIRDKFSYPMSVQFFMLKDNADVVKSKLNYPNNYAQLSLYWIDDNNIVQKHDFEYLDVKYKKGIIDTTVDLDNECVIRPFIDSTEF